MMTEVEEMIKFLEDKIEDMAITIFDLRLEVKILTDVINDLENELRAKE
jgi:prefoldin subunit 5